jgi:hypothetical protein
MLGELLDFCMGLIVGVAIAVVIYIADMGYLNPPQTEVELPDPAFTILDPGNCLQIRYSPLGNDLVVDLECAGLHRTSEF